MLPPPPPHYSNRAHYVWIQLWTIPEIQCLLLLKWRMSGNSAKQQAVAISQVRTALYRALPPPLSVSHCCRGGDQNSSSAPLHWYHSLLFLYMMYRCCGLPLKQFMLLHAKTELKDKTFKHKQMLRCTISMYLYS